MNEVQQLLRQVRILEQAACEKTGTERQELQKAAAKVKMQIIKLLPERGQQQQQGSKIPDPSEYFGGKLPEGFEDNYFSGDYLTDEQRDYFSPLKVKNIENAPDECPSTEISKSYEMDPEIRRKILNAIGIPC